MDDKDSVSTNPIEARDAFHEANAPEGLATRYMRRRIKDYWARQLPVAFGAGVVAYFINPFLGAFTLYIAMYFDEVERFYLSYLLTLPKDQLRARKHLIGTVVVSVFQAIGVCTAIAIVWHFGGPEFHFFALAYMFAAGLNFSIVYRFHKEAIIAKSVVFFVALTSMFIDEAFMLGVEGKTLVIDALATIILGFIGVEFLKFIQSHHRHNFEANLNAVETGVHAFELGKELEANAKEAQRLALISRQASDAITLRDAKGRFVWVNDAFCDLFGYSRKDVLGKPTSEVLIGPKTDKKVLQYVRDNALARKDIRFEIEVYKKNGDTLWIETNTRNVSFEEGEDLVLTASRDVTELKRQTKELLAAKEEAEQAAKAKATFLATMSHEIRTPMNGIVGMADLLLHSKLNGDQKTYVETIVDSGDALLQIIDDILDFSKLDANKLVILHKPFDLRKTIYEAAEIFKLSAKHKGLSVTVDIDPDLPKLVMGDDGRVRQIIINLVGNALKFTSKGGVSIRCHAATDGPQTAIEIEVEDTGIGIEEDLITKIFDRFEQADGETTRNFGGTGLGLSISRALARKMHGDITARSLIGLGSVFSFTMVLDVAKAHELRPKDKPADASMNDLSDMTLLIAEDNRTNRLLIKKLLAKTGAELIFAEDGQQACDLFPDAGADLVLMDLSMPNKNGIEATQDIRSYEQQHHLTKTPIVALTANAFAEDREKCFSAGMDDFLTKPIKKQVLVEKLSDFYWQKLGLEEAAKNQDQQNRA